LKAHGVSLYCTSCGGLLVLLFDIEHGDDTYIHLLVLSISTRQAASRVALDCSGFHSDTSQQIEVFKKWKMKKEKEKEEE
jgi:hypothetical protein